jgi:hypothetical protein
MVCNEFVGHCARKTTVPAFRVKAEQVIAIGVSLADPQFPDDAAIRQRLVHIVSPIVTSPAVSGLRGAHAANRIHNIYVALQQ